MFTPTTFATTIGKAIGFLRAKPHPYQCTNLLRSLVSPRSAVVSYQPVYLYVSITDHCQLRCDMCHAHSPRLGRADRSYHHMPLETYKRVVDTFKHAANISIVADGEPLLNPWFFDMVSYAKRVRRARVTTLSNGCFRLGDVDRLLSCGLDLISVSLKSHDSQDFTRMTGLRPHVFDSVVKNVRVLTERAAHLRRRPQIAVSFILDKLNYRHFEAMVERAKALGADRVKFDPFIPLPLPGCRLTERCLTTADSAAIDVLSSHAGKRRDLAVRPPIVLDTGASNATCHSFFRVMRVDTAGHVSGCVVSHPALASDHTFSEGKVWNGRYFQLMRSRFLCDDDGDVPAPCKVCYQYCGRSLW